MTIDRPLVSSGFRQYLATLLPGLEKQPEKYWPILGWLLFGPWRCETTGQLVIGNEILAELLGKQEEHRQRHFSGKKLMLEFSRDVVPLVLNEDSWDYVGGPLRMRRIVSIDWPANVLAATAAERRNRTKDLVFLDDGSPFTPTRAADIRQMRRDVAAGLLISQGCAATIRVASYLNSQPSNRFAKLVPRIPGARAIILNSTNVDRQLDILNSIELNPQPIYGPGLQSARVFGLGDNIMGLRRDARKYLTHDWHHADLRSCQLAVVARIWGIPEVQDFLLTRKSIWPELLKWMGLQVADDHAKGVIKRAVYGVVYGQGRDGRRELFQAELGDGSKYRKRFDKHPLIHTMLEHRATIMGAIRMAGGIHDAFGRWLAVEQTIVNPRHPKTNIPSLMAIVAQSYETLLLLPALALAEEESKKKKPGMVITMWLHDGFAIDVSDSRNVDSWKRRLSTAVDASAEALGICSQLVWE